MDLLEDLVDVDRERFSAATAAFLARCSFGSFFSHDENKNLTVKRERERESECVVLLKLAEKAKYWKMSGRRVADVDVQVNGSNFRRR